MFSDRPFPLFPSDVQLVQALLQLISKCLYESLSEEGIQALFSHDFHPHLRRLLAQIIAKHQLDWREQAIRSQVTNQPTNHTCTSFSSHFFFPLTVAVSKTSCLLGPCRNIVCSSHLMCTRYGGVQQTDRTSPLGIRFLGYL